MATRYLQARAAHCGRQVSGSCMELRPLPAATPLTTESYMVLHTGTPRRTKPLDQLDLPPDPIAYRVKNRLLGRPLHTEELEGERLGNPTALAVFASDNLSSSAYATEEILRVLVPAVGLAAFSLVVPVTIAMLVVLAFLILSYRQTIKQYPSAGGAYIVTKDNFGLIPAQVAGVSLLLDYVLTVAVSVAAGTAALTSAFPLLTPGRVPIAVAFIILIAFGNLRGVRESGRLFAAPTYFFMVNMAVLLCVGVTRMFFGGLPAAEAGGEGVIAQGTPGSGLLFGATIFVVLHAFASGGAAVTGVEAISNGVPAFREPSWRNARFTLVVMGTALGIMFLGLSILAANAQVVPYLEGTPTVLAQVGRVVYGETWFGQALFYSLQAGTLLILVLAANTSFADFPRLASFAAGDSFLPRQLTARGHRLVFSNGIISLSVAATLLVIVTGATVERLIPLYAIGVFTSFTLSQAGMARFHLREREEGWRPGLFVNGTGALLSLVVAVIVAITKFADGAWVILVLIPIMVALLLRLNRQYVAEQAELEADVPAATGQRTLRRHTVLVMVDQLDVTVARALQYARTLTPDELRAVHIDLDPMRTRELADEWTRLGLVSVPLQIVAAPDRRLTKTLLGVVAEDLENGETEVTVLVPRRVYNRFWHRLLHDRTSERIAEAVSLMPHANATIVPYHLGALRGQAPEDGQGPGGPTGPATGGNGAQPTSHGTALVPAGPHEARAPHGNGRSGSPSPRKAPYLMPKCQAIAEAGYRQKVTVGGVVQAVRLQTMAGAPTLECTLHDGTGRISVVFLGRRQVPGVENGAAMRVSGRVGEYQGRMAILSPDYHLLSRSDAAEPPPTKS